MLKELCRYFKISLIPSEVFDPNMCNKHSSIIIYDKTHNHCYAYKTRFTRVAIRSEHLEEILGWYLSNLTSHLRQGAFVGSSKFKKSKSSADPEKTKALKNVKNLNKYINRIVPEPDYQNSADIDFSYDFCGKYEIMKGRFAINMPASQDLCTFYALNYFEPTKKSLDVYKACESYKKQYPSGREKRDFVLACIESKIPCISHKSLEALLSFKHGACKILDSAFIVIDEMGSVGHVYVVTGTKKNIKPVVQEILPTLDPAMMPNNNVTKMRKQFNKSLKTTSGSLSSALKKKSVPLSHGWLFANLKRGRIPNLATEPVASEIDAALKYLSLRIFNPSIRFDIVITCIDAYIVLTALFKNKFPQFWMLETLDKFATSSKFISSVVIGGKIQDQNDEQICQEVESDYNTPVEGEQYRCYNTRHNIKAQYDSLFYGSTDHYENDRNTSSLFDTMVSMQNDEMTTDIMIELLTFMPNPVYVVSIPSDVQELTHSIFDLRASLDEEVSVRRIVVLYKGHYVYLVIERTHEIVFSWYNSTGPDALYHELTTDAMYRDVPLESRPDILHIYYDHRAQQDSVS